MGKTSTYCASAVCNMWHEMVMEKVQVGLLQQKNTYLCGKNKEKKWCVMFGLCPRWLYGCSFCFRWLMRGALAEACAHRGILIFIVKG